MATPTPPPKFSGAGATVGLCVFPWSPYDIALIGQTFPTVRVWADLAYTWTAEGSMFEPLASGRGDYDTLFDRLQDGGCDAFPVLENLPTWFNGGGDRRWHDTGTGDKATDYARFCDDALYNLVARYGTVAHPFNSLNINQRPRWTGDPVNEKKSGLGLFRYVEIENEPTRWWKVEDERYTPAQYAALLLASYRKVKATDPAMQVVLGGLSEPNLTYLRAMKAWFDARSEPFPCDVLNVHYYANDGNKDIPGDEKLNLTQQGCAPEADGFFERMKRIVDFGKSIGKEVWLTEYGYDTGPRSVQRAPAFGPYDAEAVAAMWMQRTVLESMRAGVARTYAYNATDEPSWHPGQPETDGLYRSCGVFTVTGQPKKPFYALKELIEKLNGFFLKKDMSGDVVRVLQFTSPEADRYAFWMGAPREAAMNVIVAGKVYVATEKVQFVTVPKGRGRYRPKTEPGKKAPAGKAKTA